MISSADQEASLNSLESTYRKLSNAYVSMEGKGANTTLVKKRRDAVKAGIESLRSDWYGNDFSHERDVIATSQVTLEDILPSIHKQLAKAKDGSPQLTLNVRRLTALNLAIESLKNRLG
ncbi:hypothetical protein QU593_03850 [Rossellomorea marisflavi]|uniref:hypothetical protein n=1 Tax=Rossellomorea TaxID=2837508 RepID=UPI0025AEFD30|nr:hypothetical protein [Rossellomorea marisflavi]WJV19627.1 hypothetical protein QU593_03850 [Rossellomorea marisflavi]